MENRKTVDMAGFSGLLEGYGGHNKSAFLMPRQHLQKPMAEFVMKDLVRKGGLGKDFLMESAAVTSRARYVQDQGILISSPLGRILL